jgi:single-stranded-DNA-specific exonuclease
MVPLVGVNRVLAKRGMELLTRTSRPGLVALKNVAGLGRELDCSSVSFGIGPRLNAAGRMVHGEVVIELLTTEDSKRAQTIARKLDRLNSERQDVENTVKEAALTKLQALDVLPAALVVWDKSFHTGVVGIVAQRLVETFHRPAIVFGADGEGEYRGSARGIKNFSVIEALSATAKYCIKYGGHEGAGGLSVKREQISDFAAAFIDVCEARLSGLESGPFAEADTEVVLKELTPEVVNELKLFSPCGMGNPAPSVAVRGLKVLDVTVLKGAHLKAMLTDGRCYIPGLLWRCSEHPALVKGSTVDIVCRPGMSTFSGYMEIQATLQAVEAV